MSFCHLHVHNEYSLLDGTGTAENYAARAKELGMTHLAITNHGNVDGCIKFQKACLSEGIKPIIGVEAYIVRDLLGRAKGESRKHIVLLANNEVGWTNMCRMMTVAHMEGFFNRPRISPDLLLKNREGLVILTACTSSFITELWGLKLLDELIRDNKVFIEMMPLMFSDQKIFNKTCMEYSDRYGLDLVATNDCHYVDKHGYKYQEVLLAMQSKKKWNDPNRWKFDVNDLYLKSEEEMANSFRRQGVVPREIYERAISNTAKVAELCGDFIIPEKEVSLPLPPEVRNEDPVRFFDLLCRRALREKVKSDQRKTKKYDEYVRRYLEEKEVIVRQGFVIYFLIVWELVNWCKRNDIMVGPGRGSSGGSLICYLLNITSVDPIEHNLIFARFISPARIDLPDIDMDFEDTKRGEIREHLEEIYGKYHVAGVSTFAKMKGRSALRDVARVFDVPIVDTNKAASSIVVRSGGDFRSDFTIEDAFNTFEDGIRFKKKYPEVTDIAISLEGQVKGKGMHAAAIIISTDDLREGRRANLLLAKEGQHVVNWDKHDSEYAGLMKLDVLGLNTLTILNEARKAIKINKGVDIDFEKISLDDPKCYEEFSNGNNIGCFQVGSLGLRRLCVQLGVENFKMLVHATSLHRPGTLRSGMVTEFTQRKRGEKKWKSKHKILEEITKDTFGVILYQEQVMRFMYDLGGLGWKTADTVRKVISKSQGVEQFLKFKDMFVKGCIDRKTLDAGTAEKLWDELASFGSYGFNLSHAVEYSIITYWCMWLKVYYPEEFFCSFLTFGPEDKKADILEEAFRMGLRVELPKIGRSSAKNWTASGGKLYMPFVSLKGVGEKTAEACANLVNEGFSRVSGNDKKKEGVNKTVKKVLEDIGAYDLDKELSEDEEERISKYFSVSIERDPSKKYKKVISKISEGIKFSNIGDIDWKKKADKVSRHYFGRMTEVRFGYREKVTGLSSEKKMEAKGTADSLGGVYGNLKDQTDFVMLVFNQNLYQRRKEEIEHCSDKFMIAKASRMHHNNLDCSDVWFQDDILAGDLKGLHLSMKKRSSYEAPSELVRCELCELRQECRKPVLPSPGRYNVMIIGEAPGKEEDRQGVGFVGDAGEKILWKELASIRLSREMFHVTNAVKCFPSKTRTPSKKHITRCSEWLFDEVARVKPFLVLAFGNTNLYALKGEESGIMNLNGTTEWNDKIGAWVCWCIHPASVLYHRENIELFRDGLANFKEKFIVLGGS